MMALDWIAGLFATLQELAGLLALSLNPRRP